MKIFIGGAGEDDDALREIEAWISGQDHEPWPWDETGTFPIGLSTLPRLIEISREVQAAVLLFNTNDVVYYRKDTTGQPRDNVLIEYGIFASALGPEKCAIALIGDAKLATDLAGITYLDFRGKRKPFGRLEFNTWLRKLSTKPIDPATAKHLAMIQKLEDEAAQLKEENSFEREKSAQLENILKKSDVLDFDTIDLDGDGFWKLLFDFRFVNEVSDRLKALIKHPQDLKLLLTRGGFDQIVDAIGWVYSERGGDNLNPQESGKFCRKVLRAFRQFASPDLVRKFAVEGDRGITSAFRLAAESDSRIK
jgi:hypothetical protein